MGMYHVLTVNEDALAFGKADKPEELIPAVGAAVVTLCIEPESGYLRGPNLEQLRSHSILNSGSAIRHAAHLHHTNRTVLFFYGGEVRQLESLTEEELRYSKQQIESVLSKFVAKET